jgi:hypothetical protein
MFPPAVGNIGIIGGSGTAISISRRGQSDPANRCGANANLGLCGKIQRTVNPSLMAKASIIPQ